MGDVYPFGDPEGARSNILESFIRFEGSGWGGLAMEPSDRSVRVIVGSKGSGKTVFLRRLHAHALEEARRTASIYAEQTIATDPPSTDLIIRFSETERYAELTEAWSQLWYRAILRAVASHVATGDEFQKHLSAERIRELTRRYARLLGKWRRPRSIYNQLSAILLEKSSRQAMHKYLNDTLWGDLESDLADALRGAPPVFLYVDYLDENFEASPMHWHRCQLGLFDRVMAILRDQALGGRLHVIVAVRDVVYASLLRSEHRGRYVSQPHIRLLNWDQRSIKYFLDRKINAVGAKHLVAPAQEEPIVRWLGRSSIANSKRQIDENAYTYLLRHTRLLPRDIVTLGNEICWLIERSKGLRGQVIMDAELREVVRKAAAGFGLEQLRVCANHLAALALPAGAARDDYVSFYIGNLEYSRQLVDILIDVLREGAGKDRLNTHELLELRRLAQERIAPDADLPSVLWQNGLIGYVDEGEQGKRDVFFPISGELGFSLPSNRQEYVFHSCLIDAIGLRAIGAQPVAPTT